MKFSLAMALAFVSLVFVGVASTYEHPPVETVQRGYRGLGMVEVYNPRTLADNQAKNKPPQAQPPATPSGQKASQVYQNVKVLGDIDVEEFNRLMTSIAEWVAPQQGCAYCHTDNMAADDLYTKRVARRMIEMTRHINQEFKNHVDGTGVTCYTCHRGNPVPAVVSYPDPGLGRTVGMAGNRAGQNAPSPAVAYASLPNDPFSNFLEYATEIRVVSHTALPEGSKRTIKQTEHTYGLMMHISQALGVNCTFCHNSRSFFSWDQSTPQRATAYYGIRMVRDLNKDYLAPLKDQFPPNRLGPDGQGPILNCATCHQGAYKPLYGASIIKDYPELASTQPPVVQPAASPAPPPAPPPTAAPARPAPPPAAAPAPAQPAQ